MTSITARRTLYPLVAALLLLAAWPAIAAAQEVGVVVHLDPPDDVDYWVCGETDTRLHWGAVGCVIDEWDTHGHGFDHDDLIWYRYRYVYPDGRTYQIGYEYTLRANPDPCVRPGTWATHNWPCCSPDSLVPMRVVAVRRRNPPPPSPTVVVVERPVPAWNPPTTTVTVNTRWYPPPPTVTYTTSYRAGSRWGFYAGWSFSYAAHHRPYHCSRYHWAGVAFVGSALLWGATWNAYNTQTAMTYMQANMLQQEYQEVLRQPGPPMVDYIGELAARLQGVERYTGSAIEKASTAVITSADDLLAGIPEKVQVNPDDEAARVPARLYSTMPEPDLQTVGKEKSPAEYTASLVQDMKALVIERAASAMEDVSLLDQRLGLWSGREPALPRRGMLGANSPRLVSDTTLEQDTDATVGVIERAVAAFDDLTGFVETDDSNGVMEFRPATERPVFSLASDTTIESAVGQRDYQRNPEPVNILALVPDDEEEPMQAVSSDTLQRTVNFHKIEWTPLPERYRAATGETSENPLLAPPALRGDAQQVWERFFLARSR